MSQTPAWHWFVVIGIIVVLTVMGLGKRAEFERESRRRGCISNQNTIDKIVGVWEAQNRALPTDRELAADVSTDGRVTRVSPDLAAFQSTPAIPPRMNLRVGSVVFREFGKDPWIFNCPTRYRAVAEAVGWDRVKVHLEKNPEVHYRWLASPARPKELDGRVRGALCLLYGELGERGEPDTAHMVRAVGR